VGRGGTGGGKRGDGLRAAVGRRYAGRWRSVCSWLAAEVKAAEAMAVAMRSMEVVIGTQETSTWSSSRSDSDLSAIDTLVEHQENLVDSPAPKHLCSKRRDQTCKTLMQTILAPTEHAIVGKMARG
jgi:hypothetical protein